VICPSSDVRELGFGSQFSAQDLVVFLVPVPRAWLPRPKVSHSFLVPAAGSRSPRQDSLARFLHPVFAADFFVPAVIPQRVSVAARNFPTERAARLRPSLVLLASLCARLHFPVRFSVSCSASVWFSIFIAPGVILGSVLSGGIGFRLDLLVCDSASFCRSITASFWDLFPHVREVFNEVRLRRQELL
jgi:hypothetical protein